MQARLKSWARSIKRDAVVVWLAARDPRTPWAVRLLALAVAAYAFSPIDLIPDFIPVLGLLDDLVLVPLGLMLVIRLMPPALMADIRERAQTLIDRPVSRAAAVVVIAVWTMSAAAFGWILLGTRGVD